jgi:hypothetical protein
MQVSRAIATVLVAAAALTVSGCAAAVPSPGAPITRDVDVEGATAVVLSTPGDLVIHVGDTAALEIRAGENIMETLTARVSDGVLRLGGSGGAGPFVGDIRYDLTLPSVSAITVEGSGSISGDLAGAQDLTVDIRGSGDVSGENLDAATVETLIEGSGTVRLAGTTTEQSVSIRGSGDFEGVDLSSTRAVVDIAGSGDAEVTVTDRLKASIAGSGDVRHAGGAKVDASIAGSGDVSAL